MDAIEYYFRVAIVWILVALPIVFTILAFHYNGALVFRWIAVGFWAISAVFFFSQGRAYSINGYYYLGIIFVGLGIVMAFIRTDSKHETQAEDVGTPDSMETYIANAEKNQAKINRIRNLGKKKPPLV